MNGRHGTRAGGAGPRARATAAALLAFAVGPVLAAPPASAADEPVTLPGVRLRLAEDEECAGASEKAAEAQPWTRQALDLDRTWQLTEGGGVTVAVVDTGVGGGIPALSGRMEALGDADEDCVGHGSFAAGLIAAAPSEDTGVAGVAPGARILAVRGANERGATTPEMVADGITEAVDAGADVVYVAQTLLTGREELTEAVRHATDKDVLVVAPAAPDTAPLDAETRRPDLTARPYYPAFIPEVLSVMDYGDGGTRPDNAPDPFAPDLAAPGDAVVSTGPEGTGHYIGSGSSLAAASAAGAAALVRAHHPEMTAAEVTRQLVGAAYPARPPRLDPYGSVSAVLPDEAGRVPSEAPARVTASSSDAPRKRAIALAGGFGALVLLVAAAAVVIPRGRARGWRPAGQ